MPAGGIQILDRASPLERLPRLRQRAAADPRFQLVDSSESRTVRQGNLPAGATTLFTAGAQKRAMLRGGLVLLHNPTAAAITADLHHVPSGGAAGSANKLGPTKTVAVDETSTFLANRELWHVLMPGDALVINTGGAGLGAWLVALEERAELCAFIGGFQGNLAAGELGLFTVPALRTALAASLLAYNSSAGSRTLTTWAKAGSAAGTDADELTAATLATNTSSQTDLGLLVTRGEGGVFSARGSDAAGGLNVWISAVLM
jgi:hypothetical protein